MTKGVNKQIILRKYGKIYHTGNARHEEDGRTEGVLPHEGGTQHRLSGVYPHTTAANELRAFSRDASSGIVSVGRKPAVVYVKG